MTEPDRPRPRPTHLRADTEADIPSGGITVTLPEHRPSGPRRSSRRTRRQRVVAFARTGRGRWTIASIVAVLVLFVGLLSKGFLSSSADPIADAPPGAASGALESLAPTTVPSSPAAKPTGPASAKDVRRELKARVAQFNNPLNQLRSPGVHTVSVSVTTSGTVGTVGYLIPTSINTNYAFGTTKVKGGSFGISTKAVGPGYLALVFVQADAKGTAVTCRVVIDGKATSTETTAGPYARQVCLG